MATYTKQLTTLDIRMIDHTTITIEDTVECPVASQALTMLQSHGYANISTEEGDYIIFSSGIAFIKVSKEQSEPIETPDTPC